MDIQVLAKVLASKKDLTHNQVFEYMDLYGFTKIPGAYSQLTRLIQMYSSKRK